MSKATEINKKNLYSKVEGLVSRALFKIGIKGVNYIPEGIGFDYTNYKVELTIKITKHPGTIDTENQSKC